jgi:V/A-type H+-transporting ATPase subunit F
MSAYKVAIVGPKSVISGFKALGVTPMSAENSDEALSILRTLKEGVESDAVEKYATVILIESLAKGIAEDDMEKITRGALPAIVMLPGLEGSSGAGIAKLKALAEKAVGSDVLS